jgi:hypothetical protein
MCWELLLKFGGVEGEMALLHFNFLNLYLLNKPGKMLKEVLQHCAEGQLPEQ